MEPKEKVWLVVQGLMQGRFVVSCKEKPFLANEVKPRQGGEYIRV